VRFEEADDFVRVIRSCIPSLSSGGMDVDGSARYDAPMRRLSAGCCHPDRRRRLIAAALVLLPILWSGCTTVGVTATKRSSLEQRLLTRSLERAAARLDTRPLQGRTVKLELYALTEDQVFARELLKSRLETRGVRIASGSGGDVTLRILATALAVDIADSLVGVPAIQVPVLAIPIPEIALFKWERSRGHSEVQSYVYDVDGRLVDRVPDVLGEARWNRFTVLIFIKFSTSDLDRPATEERAAD
jgi:hypothetical protein